MEYMEKTYLYVMPSLKFQSKKVKFALEQATKAQRGSFTVSLTLVLDGGGWSLPYPN
jgi:hypothetical protein